VSVNRVDVIPPGCPYLRWVRLLPAQNGLAIRAQLPHNQALVVLAVD
jgi:hypothetical protein